jgi:hypothetical protein
VGDDVDDSGRTIAVGSLGNYSEAIKRQGVNRLNMLSPLKPASPEGCGPFGTRTLSELATIYHPGSGADGWIVDEDGRVRIGLTVNTGRDAAGNEARTTRRDRGARVGSLTRSGC